MIKSIFFILLLPFSIYASNFSNINQETDTSDISSNYYLFDYIESLTAEDYTKYADSIKEGLSEDYFSLRMAYTKTDNYSPYDIETGKKRKRIEDAIDENKLDLALSISDSILSYNFVDIYAHLYRGYIYEQLGDTVKSNFYYKNFNGLLESILFTGDGNTPETAYLVISTKEEYSFLSWFSLQFKEQELIYKDKYAFDLMKAAEKETGEEFEIYFNITLALNVLGRLDKN